MQEIIETSQATKRGDIRFNLFRGEPQGKYCQVTNIQAI